MEHHAKRHFVQAYGNAVRVPLSRHGPRSFEHIMGAHAIALVDAQQPDMEHHWVTSMDHRAAGNVCDTQINAEFNAACRDLLRQTNHLLLRAPREPVQGRAWNALRRARFLFFNALTSDRSVAQRVVDAWHQYDGAVREMLRLQPVGNEDYYWAAADALNKARALGQVMDQEL